MPLRPQFPFHLDFLRIAVVLGGSTNLASYDLFAVVPTPELTESGVARVFPVFLLLSLHPRESSRAF